MTTLEKAKTYLGISVSTYDSTLTALVSSVNEFLENYLGRKIEAETGIEEYYDADGRSLYLNNIPVNGITSIHYNAGTQNTPNWTEIEAEYYTYNSQSGEVRASFPSGFQNIKVVYDAGFASVPGDIEQVANELVGMKFENRKSQGKSQEGLDGTTIAWSKSLSPVQKMTLDKYKKIAI